MTLIGFNTSTDRAEIITDTWTYQSSARSLGATSKVHPLMHLDAAVMTQGDTRLAYMWNAAASFLAEDRPTFDNFLERAPEALRDIVCQRSEESGVTPPVPTTFFHVGYSDRAGRFLAVAFATDRDLEPVTIEGLFVTPAPFTMRPHDIELDRFAAEAAGAPRSNDAENLALLRGLPVVTDGPDDLDGWVSLALSARQHRSIDASANTRLKVLVGGDLHYTRVERGAFSQARLMRFNDQGDELARVMTGTLHPIGQAMACSCGSGKRYAACCLAPHVDKPCLCGSGTLLRDCCLIEDTSDAPVRVPV